MKRTVWVLLTFFDPWAEAAIARQATEGLTDQQRLGRQILAQSCAVCHLPSGPGAKTYGPPLNKSTLPEDDDAIRQTILEGTTRMPAFKYFLQPAQIDAIIAYLRTIPAPARLGRARSAERAMSTIERIRSMRNLRSILLAGVAMPDCRDGNSGRRPGADGRDFVCIRAETRGSDGVGEDGRLDHHYEHLYRRKRRLLLPADAGGQVQRLGPGARF